MSFAESMRSASPGRQFALAIIAVAVIGVALAGAYFAFWRSPYETLFSNLRTSDAATIIAELDKKKTPYRLTDKGTTILVPAKLVDSIRLAVMSENLPLKGTVGFELFNKSDMGLTEFAQKINYQRALQGELARTIMTMDTVDTARVHLSLPEPSAFREDSRPAKASITVVPRAGRTIEPGAVRGIQRLVAAAVEDLAVNDVVVLDERGDVISSDAPPPPALTPEAQEKAALEAFYAAKIKQALTAKFPAAKIDVTVWATAQEAVQSLHAATPEPAAKTTFSLKVTVGIAPFPDPAAQEEARAATADAIGYDASRGDSITVTPTLPVSATPVEATVPAPLPQAASPPTGRDTRPTAWLSAPSVTLLLAGLVIVLGVGVLLLLRRGRPAVRRLTEDERDDYVQRLRALLETGDANAPSA